jgi:hypothetical protein
VVLVAAGCNTPPAEHDGVIGGYVCRVLLPTCRAPDIVEAILDGRQPKGLRLADMLGNTRLVWDEQRSGGALTAMRAHKRTPVSASR